MVEREKLSKNPELPLRIEPETLKFKPVLLRLIWIIRFMRTPKVSSKPIPQSSNYVQ